ncbi:MAG TPA: hypothetical protein VES01_08635 [Dermatophilaceae bacterium]|nr:hypothetical protein [Dermatophilaceae bacterium]
MTPDEQRGLLTRFEPQLRFTAGELFFPMPVEDYVADAALVIGRGDEAADIAARGTLTLERLAELGQAHANQGLSLRHVNKSLDRKAYRAWRHRDGRTPFRPSSRFAAVGLPSRLVDSAMRLTLLLRGSVPGGFTAAAETAYRRTGSREKPCYYGHVTQEGGYTVLQYWYFYAMNDWRSTFGGINDHEADWEQVTVFLVEEPDEPPPAPSATPAPAIPRLRPAWVAFSSHDQVGEDLRRRWDDPDLTLVGEHPVVFSGAGSHSGAYLRGEYLIGAAIPLPGWVRAATAAVRARRSPDSPGSAGLSIPYIDYKRGDGATIGKGDQPWTCVVIDDSTPWVRDYAGLWGLDTSDPFGGERAPAGPRFERNQTVRHSWGQPVAWAGLDKVSPTPAAAQEQLAATHHALTKELGLLEVRLQARRDLLRGATAAERALGPAATHPGRPARDIATEVATIRTDQAQLKGLLDGVELALRSPTTLDPVGHLRRRAVPIDPSVASGRLLRLWTAASTSILMAGLGVLLLRGDAPLAAALWVAGAMLVVEAVLRRRLLSFLSSALLAVLAVVAVGAVVSVVVGNLRSGFAMLLLLGALYFGVATMREAIKTR